MKNKRIWFTPAVLSLCFGVSSFAQASDIDEIKALEAKLAQEVSKEAQADATKDTLSPKQVVIVNNGSANSQKSEQKTESKQEQKAESSSTAAWGTGDNIDGLRQDRRSVEQVNEQVLMEKLEQSRIEDEKSRLDRLFKVQEYNRRRKAELGETDLNKADIVARESEVKVKDESIEVIEEIPLNAAAPVEPVKKVVVPEPVINYVVAPAPQALTPHASSYSSESTLVAPPLKAAAGVYDEMYIRGIMAAGGYTEVDNVNAQTSWGVALGKNLSPRTFLEGQIVKAKFKVDDPLFTNSKRLLDQYHFSGLFGYKIGDIGGKFEPHLRAGLSYVRRDSQRASDRSRDKQSSNSFDGIVGVGGDFKIANNVSITGTAEYYFNVLDDVSSSELRDRRADSKIEDENYFIIGVGLKLDF